MARLIAVFLRHADYNGTVILRLTAQLVLAWLVTAYLAAA